MSFRITTKISLAWLRARMSTKSHRNITITLRIILRTNIHSDRHNISTYNQEQGDWFHSNQRVLVIGVIVVVLHTARLQNVTAPETSMK